MPVEIPPPPPPGIEQPKKAADAPVMDMREKFARKKCEGRPEGNWPAFDRAQNELNSKPGSHAAGECRGRRKTDDGCGKGGPNGRPVAASQTRAAPFQEAVAI